jgi:hypothetical protein
MIELYNSNTPDKALILVRGRYFMLYTEDGKQHRVSLGTRDLATARMKRDAEYVKFLANGAQLCKRKAGRTPLTPPDAPEHVHYRHPWQARVGGRSLGYFATMGEAEARVRGHFGNAKGEARADNSTPQQNQTL